MIPAQRDTPIHIYTYIYIYIYTYIPDRKCSSGMTTRHDESKHGQLRDALISAGWGLLYGFWLGKSSNYKANSTRVLEELLTV